MPWLIQEAFNLNPNYLSLASSSNRPGINVTLAKAT